MTSEKRPEGWPVGGRRGVGAVRSLPPGRGDGKFWDAVAGRRVPGKKTSKKAAVAGAQ